MRTPTAHHDSRPLLAIGVTLTLIGGAPFNILPLITAAAVDTLGFSDRQAGVVSFTLSALAGASALLAGSWVRSVSWPRAAAFSLGGMLLANAMGLMLHGYWWFVVLQGLSGFMSSAAFALGMTLLSDRPESARGFGITTALQVVYQVVILLAGPWLLGIGGID
ncbi:MAG TPA: hypothetical protein VHV81_11090, partial [Steroidobacteraceae bacterium]|nr:hypothetical protein [Steroidobacteraceae bacterium]